MKKYPYSKQVIKVMLATALVATPFAVNIPVFGPSVTQAAENQDVDQLVSKLVKVNKELKSKEKAEIKKVRNNVVNLSDNQWETILGSVQVDEEINIDDAVKDLTLLLITTETDKEVIKSDIGEYKEDYDETFYEIFKGNLSFENLLEIFSTFEENVKDEILDSIKAGNGFNIEEATQKAIKQTAKDESKYDGILTDNLGIGIEGLFNIQTSLEEKVDPDGHYKNNIKNGLIRSIIGSDDSDSGSGGSGGSGGGSGGSGGSGGGGGSDTPPTDSDDDDQDSGVVESPDNVTEPEQVTGEDGVERVIHNVDTDKLTSFLDKQDSIDTIRFAVEKSKGAMSEIRLPMEAVKAIETKAEGSFVEIEAAEATVQLPVSALVQTEEEAAIRVAINETKAGADVLEKKDLNTKTPIVEFEVSVLVNGEEKPLTRFDKHIARTIKGEDTFDAKNSVVLRLDDESDDFTAAPTIIKGSKATFKTQHFSKYVVVEHEKKFADIPVDYWAEDYFDKLASRFIFQGRSDNTVAPGEEMRRAQFAALIVRSLGLSAEGEYNGEFTDVDADDWFTDEIQPAIEQGIIQGRKDGTFAPNESVTRQQAAAMLARAMEIIVFDHGKLDKDRSIDSFTDKERIGDWAKDEVELLMQAGVIDGRENGTIFDPKVGTTRAQMAKMLHEYLTFVEFMN